MKLVTKLRAHPKIKRVVHAARRHKLTVALIFAIGAVLVLTSVSVSLYYAAGFYRYDLSRPDYAKERTQIAKPEAQKDYDTTSPVTKATVDTFLQEFDARQKDLKAYGDYQDSSLSDDDLQLTSQ